MLKEIPDSIAFVFSGLYVGGAEKIGISLANKFAEDGYATHIFFFEDVVSHLHTTIDSRIEQIHIPRKSKLDVKMNLHFDEAVKKRGIKKVIFFCLNPLLLTRIFSYKRLPGVSYYITLHSTTPVNIKAFFKTFLLLQFARKSDKVIFVCRNQYHYIKSKYLFSPKNYEVIYNGVDIEHFNPQVPTNIENKKTTMQIPGKDKVILLVGTLRQEKGHLDAIRALKLLHTQFPGKENTHLVFVGGGDEVYTEKLRQHVALHSLQQFVHFEGNHKDVRPYFEIADLFTLTSFRVETFSIAALEAMCYGLPLSLTDIGGASEMVFEGKNGKLSKPKDPLSIAGSWAYLLDAGYSRENIRKIAVDNFSLNQVYKKYVAAIS